MATDLPSAIEAAGLRPRYWVAFGLISLLLICELFDYFIVGYLVSAIAPAWGLTFGQTAAMLLSAGVGAIFGALGGGRIADRVGRKRVMLVAATLCCVGTGSLALIPEGSWLMFTALRFAVGVGYGACGATQFALISEYTPRARRTLITSSMGIPAGLGLLLASSVVSILFEQLGWRGTAMLGFVPLLAVVAIAWWVPESPRWLIAVGRGDEATRVARTMLDITATIDSPRVVAVAASSSASLHEVLAQPRRFWLIVLIQISLGSVLSGVLLWGPTIVAQLFGVSAREAATYFVGVSISALVGRMAFTWLPHRIGRVPSGMLVGFGGATALLFAVLLRDSHWLGVPVFFLCLVVGQFFYDGGFSNLTTYAAELYPVRLGARALGVSAAAAGVGKIMGPLVMGLIAGASNLVTPAVTQQAVVPAFLFLAACCATVGLSYWLLGVETAHRAQEI